MPMVAEKEQMIPSQESDNVLYREVLRPPFWLLAFIFFLLSSVALSLWAVFDNPVGTIALAISIIALILIARSMTLTICLDSRELRVGRARIGLEYIGTVKELSVNEMRLVRGRDADPAAFLVLRFWQPQGIKITISDSRDPVPYWLITSKRAGELSKALTRATAKEEER